MRRWKIICLLTAGVLYLLACDQQAEQTPIELVDDAPVLGVWYLQAVGDEQPIAIDTTIRFEFNADGRATYQRSADGPDDPIRYSLAYNLTGSIISIDSQADDETPGIPRITGMIELQDEGKTLRISTHTDETWVLTRDQRPGGELEEARRFDPPTARINPMLPRVQQLAYAVNQYVADHDQKPTHIMDLISAGLVTPQSLTASGRPSDLPARFDRMTDQERRNWIAGNSVFEFFFDYAGTGQASSVVVTTLPDNGESTVVIGMANGAVHQKTAMQVARLLQLQLGALPQRWPDSAWSREATAGLEPLSD